MNSQETGKMPFLWKRNYATYLFVLGIALSIIIPFAVSKIEYSLILLELIVIVSIVWEVVWILTHLANKSILKLSILRISTLISIYLTNYVILGQFGLSIFFPDYQKVSFEYQIPFLTITGFLLMFTAWYSFRKDFRLNNQYYGIISWKKET